MSWDILHPRERCRCNKRSKKVDFRPLGLLVIPIKKVQNGCMSLATLVERDVPFAVSKLRCGKIRKQKPGQIAELRWM